MAGVHIVDLESAINWWRERSPSPDGVSACPEVRALAEVYAGMSLRHESCRDELLWPPAALQAWLAWAATQPDSPCIAICSTSQGDAFCKGCGRSFEEVQHWTAYGPAHKREVWRRIASEGTAWRFNRYAERARLVDAGKVQRQGRAAAGGSKDSRHPAAPTRLPRGSST
jgi:predicted Fe-S protein YdhL (DUF1289 family)